jgi:hypothetical protein
VTGLVSLEAREEAKFQEERAWQGQVNIQIKALDRRVTLDLSLDGDGGAQLPVLVVFILPLSVAYNNLAFMILCLPTSLALASSQSGCNLPGTQSFLMPAQNTCFVFNF